VHVPETRQNISHGTIEASLITPEAIIEAEIDTYVNSYSAP
jgi:hypothetical protein